jgi:hypothetical protein
LFRNFPSQDVWPGSLNSGRLIVASRKRQIIM